MPLNNLYIRTAYPQGYSNLGVIVVIHGWDGHILSEDLTRYYANKGFFVINVGMRGRNGADGTRDASGRELYDIYDAINYIKNQHSNLLNDNVSMIGWSGGGGNALGFACKFPDLCNVIVDFYGMSDYGYDNMTSWAMTDSWYKPHIENSVGQEGGIFGNKYRSRYAVSAITNFIGKLHIFHHSVDPYVKTIHSQKIIESLQNANKTNYITHISTPTDIYKYEHGFALYSPSHNHAENLFIPSLKNEIVPTIPLIGTFEIIGYLVTKMFEIWLDDGVSSAAMVDYNITTKTYTITPITSGSISVRIKQGNVVATQLINTQTIIQL